MHIFRTTCNPLSKLFYLAFLSPDSDARSTVYIPPYSSTNADPTKTTPYQHSKLNRYISRANSKLQTPAVLHLQVAANMQIKKPHLKLRSLMNSLITNFHRTHRNRSSRRTYKHHLHTLPTSKLHIFPSRETHHRASLYVSKDEERNDHDDDGKL